MKRKLCVLMILFLSFFVCLDRVDDIAMWMQCTDDVNEKMEGRQKEYNIYNTYAVIGNLSSGDNSGIRHLIYNGSNFYGGFGPVFLRYTNDTTYGTGKICWFNSYTTKVTDCKGSDKIDISELLQGYCPVGNV